MTQSTANLSGQVRPTIVGVVDDVLLGSPVARSLGIVLESLEIDRAVVRLPFQTSNITFGTVVHGGVIATLIDVVSAAASLSGATGVFKGGVTSNMSISYLAPADGADLMAEAVIVRRGRSQNVSDVVVRSDSNQIVAKAIVTCVLF
jgi:uncharacterized protein (TIGR00369 family)